MLFIRPVSRVLTLFSLSFFLAAIPVSAQRPAEGNPSGSAPTPSPRMDLPSANEEDADADAEGASAFRVTVLDLFNGENFAQLEEIASAARTQKSRFTGGAWKLHTFYAVLENPGSRTAADEQWNAHIARLQRWIDSKPDSITPRVALAETYIQFAWKARGNGSADTVTDDGWKLFGERIQRAQDTLDLAKPLAAHDPEWFRAMQVVALAQNWDQKRVAKLVEDAFTAEPGFYYFYTEQANYLLPKWDGAPGDSERFAKNVADRVGGPEGDAIYFQVAVSLNCCRSHPQAPDISWDRVKQGFAALEQLYGSTNYQRNAMAFLAVQQGDQNFAQQLFARIGDDWSERVWRNKTKFENAKAALSLRPAAAGSQRESTQDLVARLTPQQLHEFVSAGNSFNAQQFADAFAAYKQLLSEFPSDAILSKYASEAALNAGDTAFALTTLKPIAQADPDDWQAAALLTRACAESGDTACRDSGMAHMMDLYRRGLTPAGMQQYIVERVKVGENTVEIWTSIEPWGYYKIYAQGRVLNSDGKLFLHATLESNDGDQPLFAQQHPDEAAKGIREFSLDAYLETGVNSEGQRTQTHFTYAFFVGQPSYETVREDFLKIASGEAQPLSSRSGLIVP